MYSSSHVSTMLLRRINPNGSQNASRNVELMRQCRLYGKFRGYGRRIGVWFSEQGIQVARACTRQFEFIAAQRVRRSIQLFHLYTKIWDEVALREFMRSWRRRLGRNTREVLMSAVGVTMYNWDVEKISDEELHSKVNVPVAAHPRARSQSPDSRAKSYIRLFRTHALCDYWDVCGHCYSNEIEGLYKLRDATVVCEKCRLRLVIDVSQPGVEYCTCHGAKQSLAMIQKEADWQPFIERKDMLVWRKEEPDTGGLYAYKVYGSFPDVTADEFLQVQVDVDYRKVWDSTAKRLEIIDSDPRSKTQKDQQSDVVYWEMAWPKLFSNRDYVYERRWVVDRDRGIIVIVSKVTNHPSAPDRPDTYRVTTYWSYMVIKPSTDFHEKGIEFGLTYFDDPGVNIPSAVTTWVAMSGLPDFLCRMRDAAKDYKAYIDKKQKSTASEEAVVAEEEQLEVSRPLEANPEVTEGEVTAEQSESPQQQQQQQRTENSNKNVEANTEREDRADEYEEPESETEEEVEEFESNAKGSLSETKPEDEHGYLRYFFLTKLFA